MVTSGQVTIRAKSVGCRVAERTRTTSEFFVTDRELRGLLGIGPKDLIVKVERATSRTTKGVLDHSGMLFTVIRVEDHNGVSINRN